MEIRKKASLVEKGIYRAALQHRLASLVGRSLVIAMTAAAGVLDDEYWILNFHTAGMRAAIICFLGGLLLAVPHHLIYP